MRPLPRGVDLNYSASLPLPTCVAVVTSLKLSLWKIFSANLQVITIVNSCHFGVPKGGGELSFFLLCHLGHSPIKTF